MARPRNGGISSGDLEAQATAVTARSSRAVVSHGGVVAPRTGLQGLISTNGILFSLVASTAFAYTKHVAALAGDGGGGGGTEEAAAKYAAGLFYSGVALAGNTGVSAMRKLLAKHVGNAQQVGVATLVQGLGATLFCVRSGRLASAPPPAFWLPAVCSSCLNALVKTLETKAFAESDMSLCAPFLAFDPVMQFLVGTLVVPLTCAKLAMGCDELKGGPIPAYHVLAVATVATGAFALGRVGSKKPPPPPPPAAVTTRAAAGTAAAGEARRVAYWGPLPVGSWLILFNCVVYGFTFRLDRAAVQAAGKETYYMYGRLIMAASTLLGSGATGGISRASLEAFAQPKVALLLGLVCCLDAVYMLSLYKAVTLISPVYVAAIKRGGGVLLSSLIGVTAFGESVHGRMPPILAIAAGVVLLCMK